MVPHARLAGRGDRLSERRAYVPFAGQRIDPATDGRPDSRPDVRENASGLGDLTVDFNFAQPPRPPVVLTTTPQTDLR